ncbi:MAG: hypothetical protein AB1642_05260 [Pseudomonadota bacterium]
MGPCILLHAAAPPKPAVGAPCNGCGVCCGIAACPLSRFLLGHREGPCPALKWQGGHDNERYVCGLVAAPTGIARWLPRRLVLRWIAAGRGCDCDAETAD